MHIGAVGEKRCVFAHIDPPSGQIGAVLHIALGAQDGPVECAHVLVGIAASPRVVEIEGSHFYLVVIGQRRFHGHRFHIRLLRQIEDEHQVLVAVGLEDLLGRFELERGQQSFEVGILTHVNAGLVVGAIEVIGKERHIVSAAVVERGYLVIAPRVSVNGRVELARQPGDGAHLRIYTFEVANHCWHDIGPGFAVKYELRFLHQGTAAAVVGRVIGKAHHNLVHGRQLGSQGSFEAVVVLGALIHVRVHAV